MAMNETSVVVWFRSRPCTVHSNGSTDRDAWTIEGLADPTDADAWHEVADLAQVKFDYLNSSTQG